MMRWHVAGLMLARTYLHRMRTGIPSALVTHEPIRTFNTGANMLLAWVLREAGTYFGTTAVLAEQKLAISSDH